MPKISCRRRAAVPLEVADVTAITYEVGDTSLEIQLLPDGGLYVRGGGLTGIVIEPMASNGCVIRERPRFVVTVAEPSRKKDAARKKDV